MFRCDPNYCSLSQAICRFLLVRNLGNSFTKTNDGDYVRLIREKFHKAACRRHGICVKKLPLFAETI
jgi:hypothetical protein